MPITPATATHSSSNGTVEAILLELVDEDGNTIGTAEKLAAHHAALIKSISTDWWRWRLLEDEAALTRLKAPKGLDPKDEWLQG